MRRPGWVASAHLQNNSTQPDICRKLPSMSHDHRFEGRVNERRCVCGATPLVASASRVPCTWGARAADVHIHSWPAPTGLHQRENALTREFEKRLAARVTPSTIDVALPLVWELR